MDQPKDNRKSDDSVKVAVRVRPLVHSESVRGCQNILTKNQNTSQIIINNNAIKQDMFTYDYVFSADESQEMVYANAVKPIVQKIFLGYNVTILAYGQTGSGKTHTMGTAFDGTETENIGVIPRAVAEIFQKIEGMPDYSFDVTCSFMELYQEQLFDLLSTATREQSIVDIREDSVKGIFISNLCEVPVTSTQDATNCLIKGSAGRVVGATAMNASSSRSHAIFTITIQKVNNSDSNDATSAKFHLVDLAGSERSKKTKATGDRFKEGVKINQGLLALGNVISALGCATLANNYISYRDSKLTRLLQDSLGGNSVTLMIACVSPADYNLEETLSTLRYADRAKQIKNKPIVNQDPKTAEINKLNKLVQTLRLELLNQQQFSGPIKSNLSGGCIGRNSDPLAGATQVDSSKVDALNTELANVTYKYESLSKKFELSINDIANLNMKLCNAEAANDEMMNQIEMLHSKIVDLNSSFNADTCPAEFVVQGRAVNELKTIITGIRTQLQQQITDSTLLVSAMPPSQEETNLVCEANDNLEEAQERAMDFQNKQIDYQAQLRDIEQQLALKYELQSRLNGNFTGLCSFEEAAKADGKIKDYEAIIMDLEREMNELKGTLLAKTTANISAKLAEERRKRVRALESEIAEMKRKNLRQAQLLQQREKDSAKITDMERDIREMKQKKVQLIRTMKSESEDFRKWKMNFNKEVVQLRAKDRKRDVEMRKDKELHERQRNVLKRKVDEALMSNKRLKDALDKHKNAQAQRKKTATNGIGNNKTDSINGIMDHEIEVIFSVVDAKHALQQLIDDRAAMNMRLLSLKKHSKPTKGDKDTMASLQEDIEMRNAQISDLQNKIKSSDVDANVKSICENLCSMPEARSAVRYLFGSLTELRVEFDKNLSKLRDTRLTQDAVEERLHVVESEWQDRHDVIRLECDRLRVAKADTETAYEEKISVLLHELNDAGKLAGDAEMQKIYESTLMTLREKIEGYEEKIKEYEANLRQPKTQMKSTSHKLTQNSQFEEEPDMFMLSSEDDDDDTNDPDWHNTPAAIQRREKRAQINLTNQSVRSNDGKFNTSNGTTEKGTDKITDENRHFCNCKSDCKRKNCGCRRNSLVCGEKCKCRSTCSNGAVNAAFVSVSESDSYVTVRSELSQKRDLEDLKENYEIRDDTPKRMKLSEAEKNDLTTTPYPYNDKKKRKPLLEMP